MINMTQDIAASFDTLDADASSWFYEPGAKSYWVRRDDGNWVSMPQTVFEIYLAELGRFAPYRDAASGQKVNPVKSAVRDCVMNRRVAWAGALSGWHKGVRTIDGNDLLITKSPDLIDPVAGTWDLLNEFLTGLLTTTDPAGNTIDQRPYLYGWLKTTLQSLYAGQPAQGLAMVLAGDRDSGKTLLKDIFKEMLGKREVLPWKYMTGEERFNKNLTEAVLWVVDDEASARRKADRQFLSAQIKKITANTSWECRGMHKDAETVTTLRRLVICVNIDPDCLQVLPPLEDDIIDKISMLKCTPGAIPWPMNTRIQKDAFFAAIRAELPAFIEYLLNHHQIAEEHQGRFEIIHFQHPDIAEELLKISDEARLLEWIDRSLWTYQNTWEGSAAELHAHLDGEDSPLSYRQRGYLPSSNSIGKQLAKLAKRYPLRFKKIKRNGRSVWQIAKENLTTGEAGEAGLPL